MLVTPEGSRHGPEASGNLVPGPRDQKESRQTPKPRRLTELAAAIHGSNLTSEAAARVERIEKADWHRKRLDMSRDDHRELASWALAHGAMVFYGFGNFIAVGMHPETIVDTNRAKGRPDGQVASVTTTKEIIQRVDANGKHAIFDLTKLPEGMDIETAMKIMDRFYGMGPFGFLGASAIEEKYPLLTNTYTKPDGEQFKTIQIIAPGYRDQLADDLIGRGLKIAGLDLFAITSANVSRHKGEIPGATEKPKEQPAHWKIAKIPEDFESIEGYPFIRIGHHDEAEAVAAYPYHETGSVSILAYHRDPSETAATKRAGRPVMTLERHGSTDVELIRYILDTEFGVDLHVMPAAEKRMLVRAYEDPTKLDRAREVFSRFRAAHRRVHI